MNSLRYSNIYETNIYVKLQTNDADHYMKKYI